jgi:hypothetical protein
VNREVSVVASFDGEVWAVEDEGAEFTFGTPLANGTFLTAASDGSSLVLTAELAVGQADSDTRITVRHQRQFPGTETRGGSDQL